VTDFKEKLEPVLSSFSRDRGNLIPILQCAQQEFGYLPAEVMQAIADFLHIANSTVYSVSTFYTQFKFAPPGKKIIRVCRGTACHVRGSDRILHEIERLLGIKPGETTDDLEYSLETVACIGACALAPITIIDNNLYGATTTKKISRILREEE